MDSEHSFSFEQIINNDKLSKYIYCLRSLTDNLEKINQKR